jgi:UDP-2,3-diacylglucosamine pyrophosphatase LpxH
MIVAIFFSLSTVSSKLECSVVIRSYRTVWISDVHLGTRGSQAARLLEFLRASECETLYIVGDFVDVWSLKRGIYWPQHHNDVIQKVLRAGRKGTRVVYIPGNHDEFVGAFLGDYGAVSVQARAVHETADGRRLLVIHGHELDAVVQNSKWLAHVGDIGYSILLKLNAPLNWVRRLMGLGFWSLSAAAKRSVKNAVNYIGAFEDAVVRLAKLEGRIDGVVCGHIHTPCIRQIRDLTYYNSGDWVESLSALVEHADGSIELLHAPVELPARLAAVSEETVPFSA